MLQMGSTMKPTIFNQRVATAVKNWHHTAKKHVKRNKVSDASTTTPFSSRPSTPTYGMSPVHLLHKHPAGPSDSRQSSPRTSNYENEQWDDQGLPSPRNNNNHRGADETQIQMPAVDSRSTPELPVSNRHEISINLAEFSFDKRHTVSD